MSRLDLQDSQVQRYLQLLLKRDYLHRESGSDGHDVCRPTTRGLEPLEAIESLQENMGLDLEELCC